MYDVLCRGIWVTSRVSENDSQFCNSIKCVCVCGGGGEGVVSFNLRTGCGLNVQVEMSVQIIYFWHWWLDLSEISYRSTQGFSLVLMFVLIPFFVTSTLQESQIEIFTARVYNIDLGLTFHYFYSFYLSVQIYRYVEMTIRGGADKSLARPASPCRRTESIVSLERRVCSCAELHVFSCYGGWKEACQATHAISTTSRRELSSSFFLQGKAPKDIHAILTETLGKHAPSYATVKKFGGPV